jgi:drug/metabolite transporter (DMT)-like permease
MATTTSGRSSILEPGAFLLCTVIWGSTFLAIRYGNDATPPIWAAAIRLGLAAILLTVVNLVTGVRWPRGEELRVTLLYGVLAFGINFTLLYSSEAHIASGVAAVIYATLPLMTLGFARWMGIESFSSRKLAGGLIGLAGVAVIFLGEMTTHVPLRYLLMAFAGAISASLSSAVLKRGPHPPVIPTNAIASAVGAVICGIASVLAGEEQALPRTWAAWIPLLYLTLAGSMVAFVAYTWLLHRWGASRSSFISILVPVLAVILGNSLRHEHITRGALVGAMLVVAGLAIALPQGLRPAATREATNP